MRLRHRLAALCSLLLLAGCAPVSAPMTTTPRVVPPVGTADPADLLRLRSASVEYYQAGPVDPVVELRVILDTTATRHTDSTTILWDPQFARSFVFLRSEPAPWRVRVDEQGWGSLDTSGVLPGNFATFRLFFAVGTYEAVEPELRVIANGTTTVADVFATAPHLKWQRPTPEQEAFERGPLSAIARIATPLPSRERPSFLIGAVLAALLVGVSLAGWLGAFRFAR